MQFVTDRQIDDAGQVGTDRQSAVSVNEAGHPDANGFDVAGAGPHLRDDADHRVEQRHRTLRCRTPDFVADAPTRFVDGDRQDLGTADIDPYRQCHEGRDVSSGDLVAEQRSNAAQHVEVGVADADLDATRLAQCLVDRLFDDVVEGFHLRAAPAAVAPDERESPAGAHRQPASR